MKRQPVEVPAEVARTLDCLVGLSVGDAFGETFFGPGGEARLARRATREETPWRWTDDTAMAISIVRVLCANGTIDPDILAGEFADRYSAEPWRGYGSGAFTLLTRIAAGVPWRAEAARLFDGQGSMGNGGAMRAAPIGAYFAGDLDRVAEEAHRSAAPTHAHPDGAAGAVSVAVAAAIAADMRERGALDGTALLDEVFARTPPGPTRDGLAAARALGLDAAPSNAVDGEEDPTRFARRVLTRASTPRPEPSNFDGGLDVSRGAVAPAGAVGSDRLGRGARA